MTLQAAARQKAYRARRKESGRPDPGGHRAPVRGNVRRRFVGIDGEGGEVNGRHEYLLLRAGNHVLETGLPLRPRECLEWIADLPKDALYVGYYFGYDTTMMVKDLPRDRINRLLERDKRTRLVGGKPRTYPVDLCWADLPERPGSHLRVDYMPGKELRVARCFDHLPVAPDGGLLPCSFDPYTVINDVGSFFQCAFVKALEQWDIGTPEQRDAIGAGKEARATFGAVDQTERDYNALEIVLLQDLMESFRDVCVGLGIVPAKWQGPGNIAAALLRKHGAPKREDLTHLQPDLVALANDAYYGGRFETTAAGPVGHCWQYDINSAYPAAMLSLPCLIHGKWVRGSTIPKDPHALYLAEGRFSPHPVDPDRWPPIGLYGFPVRTKKGNIFYPAEGGGVYWSPEIRAAVHQDFTPAKVWHYQPQCDHQPFEWVQGLYDERVKLGKTAKGKVLKLALNSLYGKMAQSIGAAPYANPIYAGLITAITRAQLARAAHSEWSPVCCADVYMLATDALFCGIPRPLVAGGLGGWDADEHQKVFIVQPGLYFMDDIAAPKTRGIPRKAAVDCWPDFVAAYDAILEDKVVDTHTVEVPIRAFIGARLAWARGALSTAGQWVDQVKTISFDWHAKRSIGKVWLMTHPDGTVTLRTSPKPGGPDLVSVPYSKDIGAMLAHQRLLSGAPDSPDWADTMKDERE